MSARQGKVRSREDADYSNATINQIWGVKRLDHISGLLKIIKRFIRLPQGIVISLFKILQEF